MEQDSKHIFRNPSRHFFKLRIHCNWIMQFDCLLKSSLNLFIWTDFFSFRQFDNLELTFASGIFLVRKIISKILTKLVRSRHRSSAQPLVRFFVYMRTLTLSQPIHDVHTCEQREKKKTLAMTNTNIPSRITEPHTWSITSVKIVSTVYLRFLSMAISWLPHLKMGRWLGKVVWSHCSCAGFVF